jgi:hypothetical protein
VTFRPLEKRRYDDFIELSQLDFQHVVKIPLRAKLPEFKVEIPDELTLGVCSVNDVVSGKIKLTNLR